MSLITPSPFISKNRIIENKYAFSIYDSYPVSNGHSLVIPKSEVKSIFELSSNEYMGCFDLVKELKNYLEKKYKCQGFNIGINNGVAAGQTVYHAHIHLIPRYDNDMESPRGGIRKIFPNSDY